MKQLSIQFVFVVLCFFGHALGYVYTDYVWEQYNGHEYAITLDIGHWGEAKDEAIAVGGNLVTANDESENIWLGEFLSEYPAQYIWIGFYQDFSDPLYSEPSGGWKWISGEPVTYTNWPPNQGQPDNAWLNGEHYGVISYGSNPLWNDWGDQSGDYYPTYGIIEVPEPTTLLLLGLGGVLMRRRRHQ